MEVGTSSAIAIKRLTSEASTRRNAQVMQLADAIVGAYASPLRKTGEFGGLAGIRAAEDGACGGVADRKRPRIVIYSAFIILALG